MYASTCLAFTSCKLCIERVYQGFMSIVALPEAESSWILDASCVLRRVGRPRRSAERLLDILAYMPLPAVCQSPLILGHGR